MSLPKQLCLPVVSFVLVFFTKTEQRICQSNIHEAKLCKHDALETVRCVYKCLKALETEKESAKQSKLNYVEFSSSFPCNFLLAMVDM